MSGDGEERVRPCLECGTILPFDAEACSLCGARIGGSASSEEAVKPCLNCDALIPEEDFFCPQCGDFASMVRVEAAPTRPPLGAREGQALQVLTRTVAIAVAVGALILLAATLYDVLAVKSAVGE